MELSHQSLSELPKGPFTATKLWNEIVSQMKTNLQVKRRRWRMRVYDDVFVASEAIDWLHGYLKTNPNFGPSVNRQQAVQLCKKFLSHKIIEDARGKQYNSAVFEDNTHLYRFVNIRYSPYKRVTTPRKNTVKPPLAKQNSNDSTSSSFGRTPSKVLRRSSRFNFSRTSFSNAPSRTPLGTINSQVKYMGSIQSDSRALKSGGIKGKMNRREIDSDVIMNPAALGFSSDHRSLTEKEINDIWWNISITRLSGLLEKDCSPDTYRNNGYDIECVRENMDEQRICKASEIVPPWLLAAMKCLVSWPNVEQESSSFPRYPGFERDVFRAVVEYFDGFKEPLVSPNILPLFIMTAGLIVKCKGTAMRAIQYCCMLMKPSKRKNLQVLIKLMVKLVQNKVLVLSDTLPSQELLIKTFSRCAFGRSGDMNVIRLLFFLMENFPVCFMKPDGLQFQVEQRILFLQNCRGKVPPKTMTKNTTFCERVTTKEYKEEAMRSSQTALRDLLDKIVDDDSITEKERKKKYKQFEKSYPDIYYAKFPDDNNSNTSGISRRSLRKNFSNPLTALKNLR